MASGAGYRHSTIILDSMTECGKTGFGEAKFLKYMKYAAVGSTIHLVSNCEDVTDWDIENASHLNAVDETTDIRSGSNSIELVDVSTTKGTAVTLDDGHKPDHEDWTWANWLCIWIHDDTGARTAGELTVQLRNGNTWNTALAVPTSVVDMWCLVCIDISDENRSDVTGFRFVNQRGTGSSEKVYVDNIFVTDLITGVGDAAAVATGPVMGRVIPMPVETGATILPGDTVEWGAIGVNTGTANDERIIGVACQDEPLTSVVASDTAPKEILVAVAGSIVWFRNDGTAPAVGEPVLLGSDVVTESTGSATANAEYGFAISLENAATTAYASGDSAYILLPMGSED